MKAGCHRTEQRRLEKQRRREMVVSGDIADKLFHSTDHETFERLISSSSYSSRSTGEGSSSTRRTSESDQAGRSGDDMTRRRIEEILPPFEEAKKDGIFDRVPFSSSSKRPASSDHYHQRRSEGSNSKEHRRKLAANLQHPEKRERERPAVKSEEGSSKYSSSHSRSQEKHHRTASNERSSRVTSPGSRSRGCSNKDRSRSTSATTASRKRPYLSHESGTDTDSDHGSMLLDADNVAQIFHLMTGFSGKLSPLPKQRLPSIRTEEESEEELDISEMEKRLKSGGWLEPELLQAELHSEQVSSGSSFKAMESAGGVTSGGNSGLSEDESDIDSDVEDFKLSKSTIEDCIVPDHLSTTPAADQAPTPPLDVKHHRVHKEEEERREVKPIVAVSPRIKPSKEPIKQLIDSYRPTTKSSSTTSAVDQGTLVDIRAMISEGTPFNLVLSFGLDKLHSRSLTNEVLQKAALRHAEAVKPAEKPSCKVPCIPRDLSHDSRASPVSGAASAGSGTASDTDRDQHRAEYGQPYQRKRRRVAPEPPEFDQFPYPFHPGAGIPATLAIPSLAYLVQQPTPAGQRFPRPDLTFTSRAEKEERKGKLEKALKALLTFSSYTVKGRTLKKEADNLADDPRRKIQKYLEACIQYVYSALSLCKDSEFSKGYQFLASTVKIVDHCLLPRSQRGLDVRLQDKKLAVLCLILSSHMQRHMWTISTTEAHTLQASCSMYLKSRRGDQGKDTSTPSPAGSLISMGSYGSSCDTSIDAVGDVISSRYMRESERCMNLLNALKESTEQWEEAGVLAEECSDFFAQLDSQCGSIKQHTHLYTVASYIGQGLSNIRSETAASS